MPDTKIPRIEKKEKYDKREMDRLIDEMNKIKMAAVNKRIPA